MLSFDGWVLRAPSLQAGLAQLLDAPVLPLLILTLAGPSALAPRCSGEFSFLSQCLLLGLFSSAALPMGTCSVALQGTGSPLPFLSQTRVP